jgi:integrase
VKCRAEESGAGDTGATRRVAMNSESNISRELPRGVSISQAANGHGRVLWRVRLSRRFTSLGVIQRYFPTLAAAEEFIFGSGDGRSPALEAVRGKFGVTGLELSPRELAEAREAIALLRSSGNDSLLAAVKFFTTHHAPACRVSLSDAIAALIKAKQEAGRSPDHLYKLRASIEQLSRFCRVRLASDVTSKHVEDWLASKKVSGTTKSNAFRDVRILFRFCMARGWMHRDPLKGVERPRANVVETGIVSPLQASLLLAAAAPEILPGLAIKFFAGLRSTEVRGLDWSDITATHVIVRAANAKTRSRRAVDISANLSAWLSPFQQASGPVAPMSIKLWHRYIRETAVAVDEKAARATNDAGLQLETPPIGKLPRNFARHSFGTYHFALHQDEGRTAAAMGNTPAMVHRHYRALATSNEAREFFAVSPEKAGRILASRSETFVQLRHEANERPRKSRTDAAC